LEGHNLILNTALPQKSFDECSEGLDWIIAAERRDVSRNAITSNQISIERNAEHFARC
jgi:hypothetical protein